MIDLGAGAGQRGGGDAPPAAPVPACGFGEAAGAAEAAVPPAVPAHGRSRAPAPRADRGGSRAAVSAAAQPWRGASRGAGFSDRHAPAPAETKPRGEGALGDSGTRPSIARGCPAPTSTLPGGERPTQPLPPGRASSRAGSCSSPSERVFPSKT